MWLVVGLEPLEELQKLQRIPMRCRLSFKSDTSVANEFDEVWRRPTVLNVVAGRKAYANTGSVANRQKAELAYKFTMVGGRSQVGYTAGGVVGSPVLDDVTLTYFLSSPRVLAQEEDENK